MKTLPFGSLPRCGKGVAAGVQLFADAKLRSRGTAMPELWLEITLEVEGAGNAGRRLAPAALCAEAKSTQA
jgi:hypothetical protein